MQLIQLRTPLILREIPIPEISPNQLLIQVEVCALCRTDLHVIDGELPNPILPIIPGHQIVGKVVEMGNKVRGWNLGERVGVAWLQGACGTCEFCLSGRENLCAQAIYTGYQVNGGYAEYCAAHASFCFHLPKEADPVQLAPQLCGGLIGFRALRFAKGCKTLGFYGFGSSAHLLTQIALAQGQEIFAFTRPGDTAGQTFAKTLGATWAGGSDETPPIPLDAAIIFAPVGPLVPQALKVLKKGGKVICAGIHMSNIPSFPYALLWEERSIQSVSNLTRQDGIDLFNLALPLKAHVTLYPLDQANEALDDLRHGRAEGSLALSISSI